MLVWGAQKSKSTSGMQQLLGKIVFFVLVSCQQLGKVMAFWLLATEKIEESKSDVKCMFCRSIPTPHSNGIQTNCISTNSFRVKTSYLEKYYCIRYCKIVYNIDIQYQ